MAVFPFMNKKSEEPQKNYIPVNLVQKYASQGMSESRIIDELRNQGFNPSQVDTALRTVLKNQVAPQGEQSYRQQPRQPVREMNPEEFPTMQNTNEAQPMQPRREMPQRRDPSYENQQMPERRIAPEQRQMLPIQPQPSQMQIPQQQEESKYTFEEPEKTFHPGLEEITLEEIVEGIVAEKWQEFEERMGNFESRDLQLQEQISELRASIKEVTKLVEQKEQNLSGRFEEFGGSVSDIQGRIGSIERVFKEFIPEITSAVRKMNEKTA